MPRRNHKARPRPQIESIDKLRILDLSPRTVSLYSAVKQHRNGNNGKASVFTRSIYGFSQDTVNALKEINPINFTFSEQLGAYVVSAVFIAREPQGANRPGFDYNEPQFAQDDFSGLVLSGKINKKDSQNIGVNNSSVAASQPPQMSALNSKYRLNVALGVTVSTEQMDQLNATIVRHQPLQVSPIHTINGQPAHPGMTQAATQQLWNISIPR